MIDVSEVSATKRKKTSAKDERQSATVTGSILGIVAITLVTAFIVIPDMVVMVKFFIYFNDLD